ncbi:ATP-binding domain-containing protein, partial [Helicobacter apodemus]
GKLMIVFKYINLDIPKLIKELRDLSVPSKEADFILTTGHKSKGLEWECVEIMDDFIDLKDIASNKKETIVAKEELNLLYVAITRATQTLYLNEKYLLDLDFIKTMKKWIVF